MKHWSTWTFRLSLVFKERSISTVYIISLKLYTNDREGTSKDNYPIETRLEVVRF